ncbi:hypothetical protein E1A91_A11G167900v1 [Gossypium mustelinum]|uniref:Uncharacterized protein n=1 Tax=Gossypium mustelinum TaxID=34275 RepID=A0A5D2X7K1_GOSMU|nr:hypothetical protein E1A91_A11G167900v1 [Gossypium mustelinum]TYJ09859.1 hypothetical protein E1A91_A11G167900v1 [Gossypium mustelinum]
MGNFPIQVLNATVFSFEMNDRKRNNFVWCWLLFRCHRMAYHWHGIWVYCTLGYTHSQPSVNHNTHCIAIFVWTLFLQRIPIVGWLFQQPYIRSQLHQHPFFLLQIVLERQRACLKWQEEQFQQQQQQQSYFSELSCGVFSSQTNHSLAEKVGKEKISERMKYLQDLYQDVTKSQAKLVCLMKSSIMFNLFNGK